MREFQNYKILIIDDDETAILQLEKALKKHPLFTVAGVAKNAEKGEQLLFAQRPDILFLDVELPDAQGVEFLNSIKDSINWSMYVVFYSMHSKYILSAFRESAFDYPLKPFEQEELDGILERFRKTVITIETQAMQRKADENPLRNHFLIATVTGYKMARLEEIGYFEHHSLRKQWTAMLVDQNNLNLKRGTKAETILSYSPSFIQISQSIIINVNYLAMIQGKECKLYPPFDKVQGLQISRYYLKKLQEMLNFI